MIEYYQLEAGSDFFQTNDVVRFSAGESSAFITVGIVECSCDTSDETFTIAVESAVQTVTIVNNDVSVFDESSAVFQFAE
jgi:hypothetical protein